MVGKTRRRGEKLSVVLESLGSWHKVGKKVGKMDKELKKVGKMDKELKKVVKGCKSAALKFHRL